MCEKFLSSLLYNCTEFEITYKIIGLLQRNNVVLVFVQFLFFKGLSKLIDSGFINRIQPAQCMM